MKVNKIFKKTLLLFFINTVLFNVRAFQSNDILYSTAVTVQNRSQIERNIAFRVGLVDVIGRLLNEEDVLGLSRIETILSAPLSFIQLYGYAESQETLKLKMTFNSEQLLKKLRHLQLTPWENRPSILLWLFVDGKSISQLDENISQTWLASVTNESQKSGLSISYPIWDLKEEQTIAKYDVLPRSIIEGLSKRYAKEVILVGNIQTQEKESVITWSLYLNDEEQRWNVSLDDNMLLQNSLKTVVNSLKNQYSNLQEYQYQTILISIKSLSRIGYSQMQEYFSELSMVDKVNVASLDKSNVTFRVTINQSLDILRDAVELNGSLEELDYNNNEIKYQYKT